MSCTNYQQWVYGADGSAPGWVCTQCGHRHPFAFPTPTDEEMSRYRDESEPIVAFLQRLSMEHPESHDGQ